MTDKIKAGTINVDVPKEKTIWFDRKRVTIFALPWSFTKYTLTENKLIVEKGLFTQTEDEIKLYRISDISYEQTLLERIGNTGTLIVKSTDVTLPELRLEHIKNAKQIRDVLSQAIDAARKNNGVRAAEMVGNGPMRDLDGDGVPDVDANCDCEDGCDCHE